MSDMSCSRKHNPCCNAKCDPCHDKNHDHCKDKDHDHCHCPDKDHRPCKDKDHDHCKDKDHDHCHCPDNDHKPCKDLDTRVEFKFDERTPSPPTPIPTTTPGVELLEVTFGEVERRDRVWLSGVIAVDNTTADIVRLTIRIVKDSPNINPTTIYTLTVEIDVSSGDDVSAIPFSHVDVNNVNLFDVSYTVLASANRANALVSQGPNTLTALRFEKK